MIRSFAPLACWLAAIASASAQDSAAKRFLDSMDENRDDIISRAEWSGAGVSFVRLDTDHDGYLVEDELARSLSKPTRNRDRAEPRPIDVDAVEASIDAFPSEVPAFLTSNCTTCHNTDRILSARKDAGGWATTIERMAGKDEADIKGRDASRIAKYLEGLRNQAAIRMASFGSSDPLAAWGLVLDGAEFHRFDRDGDGRLGGNELLKLLMDRIDFDGDGNLHQGEYCLMPVGVDRVAVFHQVDKNKNGKVSSRELGVPASLLALADRDGDGALSIDELPRARRGPVRLLLAVDAETVLQIADRNRDGFINAKELRANADLVQRFDTDRNSKLSAEEIEQAISRSRAQGFGVAFDDLLTRFDLDGDGNVRPEEFPGPDLVFHRCDKDKDGVLSAKDAEAAYRRPEFSDEARRWRRGR